LQKVINYFNNKSKIFLTIIGVCLLLIVAFLDSDYLIENLDLSVLYLIPILFYAWFLGYYATIIITIVSTIVEIFVNHLYLSRNLVIFEGIMESLLFLVTALILIKLKTNITKLNNLTLQLKESLYKEKEISNLRSSFISTVSHEFRTPLTTIQAINSIIKNYSNKMSEEEKMIQRNIIQEQVDNLTKMLDEFVIIGKIESDELELNCEDINIETLFEQIIRELEISNYDTKRIKSSYTSYNCSDFFYCDKRLVRQITSNLLTNALKYSSEEIIFNIIYSSEKLVIAVKDSGIGVPEEEKKRIFEQFYRASNIYTEPGTGLGLSIVKKSIIRCNGTIDFTSKINEGTEFIVTIPNQVKK